MFMKRQHLVITFIFLLLFQSCQVMRESTNHDKSVGSQRSDILFNIKPNVLSLADSIKRIHYRITNNSEKEVHCGLDFWVERFEDESWKEFSFKEELVIPSVLQIVPINQSFEDAIVISTLYHQTDIQRGKYRLCKEVWRENERDKKIILTAEFKID